MAGTARMILDLKTAVVQEKKRLRVMRRDLRHLQTKATQVAKAWVICRIHGGIGENGVLGFKEERKPDLVSPVDTLAVLQTAHVCGQHPRQQVLL